MTTTYVHCRVRYHVRHGDLVEPACAFAAVPDLATIVDGDAWTARYVLHAAWHPPLALLDEPRQCPACLDALRRRAESTIARWQRLVPRT